MRLRPHRRNLVVWNQCAGPVRRYGALRLALGARPGRIRRCIRIGALLAVMGLVRLGRAARARWRPLLTGGALMVAGAVMGGGLGGVASFAGSLLLVFGLLIPVTPPAARRRRAELERELAAFSTPAERRDLEATLDQYPDDVTQELRDILAGQAMAAYNNRFPAAGRY